MKKVTIFILLTSLGCVASFQNSKLITIIATKDIYKEVSLIADKIAVENGLHQDEKLNKLSTLKRGYFGEPYHYYLLELKEEKNGKVLVEYSHSARLSSKSIKRNEPEEAFLRSLKVAFGDQIVEIKERD